MNVQKEFLLRKLTLSGFSKNIVKAFSEVNREEFVLKTDLPYAWSDIALPLGYNSTISQPYTIAFMLKLLELENKQELKILEIGSGCSYVLALLNSMIPNSKLFGIELNEAVGNKSIEKLSGYQNIKILLMDGKNGLPEEAPFDRILVSAAYSSYPYQLTEQLKEGGIIVTPISYSISKIKKIGSACVQEEYPGFTFVPLL
ncbi:MAG TPA: protein-L-isoaspartate O-methyltransferase [Lentisphaeria bacterium]|nr:MAG: hypothetical protein A2X47_12520 [Lentisphaerae bacterium GWF2_38_69]HBM17232.1 protein-L-isoaspartate O-methyltransferase [Lentisphaeria bacterium]